MAKTAVVGVKDRETNHVIAKPIAFTDKLSLQGFISQKTAPRSTPMSTRPIRIFRTNSTRLYGSAGEYVRQQAHTNGIESLWAMFRRGIDGTYHHVSTKHLGMYVGEFSGRHNVRPLDTTDQMTSMAQCSVGKRL